MRRPDPGDGACPEAAEPGTLLQGSEVEAVFVQHHQLTVQDQVLADVGGSGLKFGEVGRQVRSAPGLEVQPFGPDVDDDPVPVQPLLPEHRAGPALGRQSGTSFGGHRTERRFQHPLSITAPAPSRAIRHGSQSERT